MKVTLYSPIMAEERKIQDSNSDAEQDLVNRLQDPLQKRVAFGELVDLYAGKLYAQIRHMLINHEDTNDVLQEVLLKIWNGIEDFRGEAKLFTWMYRIAYYESLSFLKAKRRKQRHFTELTEDNQYLIEQLSEDPYFDGDELEIKLRLAIDELPPKQQQVFLLRHYEELSYSKIAELTGTSEGALKASFHHAVIKIKKAILK